MNIKVKHRYILKHDQKSLKKLCKYIRNLKNRIIVIEGATGSGKSTVIEELVGYKKNVFTPYSPSPHVEPFILTASESEYIGMDETENFPIEQIVEFLATAEKESKIALVSSQSLHFFEQAKQDLFNMDGVTVINIDA